MEGLSAKLQEIIESRPLKTLVDTEDTKSNTEWRDSIFVHYVSNDIPRVFDGRIVWKNYLSKIGNQGKCGSCWAWASSSALQLFLI
jgi:C1A family cysteine protease